MTIAQRELAVIGIDPKLAAPTLHRIEDARTSERGDFYYYLIERRVVGEMVDGQFQPYAIAVLLDGTTIASKSVGCPEPGRGSNSDFATVRGFLIIFATTAAAFTFFLYTPIAVFLTRTARRRLIMFGAVVAILGAALGVGRTWLFPGVDEWLVLPPGIDYAPLLGVLPALAVIEMAIRLFHPVGAKGNGIGSDNDA